MSEHHGGDHGDPEDPGPVDERDFGTDHNAAAAFGRLRIDRALGRCIRDIVEFVDDAGWGQPAQLFALVPTSVVAETEPSVLDDTDPDELDTAFTPVEQEPLPEFGDPNELERILSSISWPGVVQGCALVQEIVVLPPTAEENLDAALLPVLGDARATDRAMRTTAEAHPERREARLVVAVLRTGQSLRLLQLRSAGDSDADEPTELLEYPNLAPGLTEALIGTFDSVGGD